MCGFSEGKKFSAADTLFQFDKHLQQLQLQQRSALQHVVTAAVHQCAHNRVCSRNPSTSADLN